MFKLFHFAVIISPWSMHYIIFLGYIDIDITVTWELRQFMLTLKSLWDTSRVSHKYSYGRKERALTANVTPSINIIQFELLHIV